MSNPALTRLLRRCAALLLAGLATTAAAAAQPDLARPPAADAAAVAHWALASGDARDLPFAVIDKRRAMVHVYAPGGRLVGASPALLGLAPGDHAVPGVGAKPLAQIRPEERTTPAGRYASEPGRNLDGEDVVWVDYDAGFAIHRLRPGRARADRARRLATPTPADNRASLGCVVVPPTFYLAVVQPTLGAGRGRVYVLPESGALAGLIDGTGASRPAALTAG